VLEAVDKVEIRILADNVTDGLSSNPSFVESEMANLGRRNISFSARCLCCAVHGLSCLVTVHRGETTRTVLFDSGPEDYAFERNVSRLGIDLGVVESIVLSHGHWDHSGAMLLALGLIRSRNGGRKVPFYAHPGMFVTRGLRTPNGSVRRMDDVPSAQELTDFGAEMVVTTDPQQPLGGLFHVSGEIPACPVSSAAFPDRSSAQRTAGSRMNW
jgi:7,8-dihydropterin-6-yl-methyl-4-(beta-D-ribofuranosyl)aminobenzene 5'-phosphate synthase